MGDKPEKVTAILASEGELLNSPEVSEGNLKPYPKGGTASVARKGDPTKSNYLTFDPDGVSTINWWLNRGKVLEYNKPTRVKLS